MSNYIKPEIEIVRLIMEDIITASGDTELPEFEDEDLDSEIGLPEFEENTPDADTPPDSPVTDDETMTPIM